MDNFDKMEKWKMFFTTMANGLLPYLELYVKRYPKGGGLASFMSSRRRYQVPVILDNSQHVGSGKPSHAIVNYLMPTQQSVDQAKSLIKQNDNMFEELIKATKSKSKYKTSQSPFKHRGKQTKPVIKKKSTKKSTSKGNKGQKKAKRQTANLTKPQDIFS